MKLRISVVLMACLVTSLVLIGPAMAATIVIERPIPNERFVSNETPTFIARFSDGDGDASALVWTSDRDGYLGAGAEMTPAILSPGKHQITVSGGTVQTTITIRVFADLLALYQAPLSEAEIARLQTEFQFTYHDGKPDPQALELWSLYDTYTFDQTSTDPSKIVALANLDLLRHQRFAKPIPFANGLSLLDYIRQSTQRIELRLDCKYTTAGGGKISFNRGFSTWTPSVSGTAENQDACKVPSGGTLYPYIYALGLVLHESRHNEPSDSGHTTCPSWYTGRITSGMDASFEPGSGFARDAVYKMWVFKYGTTDPPDIKQNAQMSAWGILHDRFCEQPSSSNPAIQALIEEVEFLNLPPSLTVTSPNGGEIWKRGTDDLITWDYTGSPGSTVKIVLLEGSKEVGVIKDSWSIGSGGKGSYLWAISSSGLEGGDFKVSVKSISQPAIKDTSNNYFALTTGTITVTSPNGWENWQQGTYHIITWNFTGNNGPTVDIMLNRYSLTGTPYFPSSTTIAKNVPIDNVGRGKGSYLWKIPSDQLTDALYKVRVMSTSQPKISDISNDYFAITTGTINVTSPNGGETWQRDTSHTVTWNYIGSLGKTVGIVLLKGGTQVGTISPSTSTGSGGKGSYTWSISSSGTTGSDYRVGIQSISQPLIVDTSNKPFTLTPAPNTPSITVTVPNGGEIWQRGTTHTVTWDYTGDPGPTVMIVLLKAGQPVGTATYSTSIGLNGKGSYPWTISSTRAPGTDYQILIQSVSQPSIKNTNDGYFTITSGISIPTPSITVTAPNGGETWKRGTTKTVKWSYTGSPGSYVKVVLLKAGVEVGTATYSTSIGSGGTGSYPWSISSGRAPGTDYKILVQSVSQPTIKDASNNNFTLTL